MTTEQQRIAIAEACGWKFKKECDGWEQPNGIVNDENPPDYLHDLNAMHEAEETLTLGQFTDYGCELVRMNVNCCHDEGKVHWAKLAHASAQLRAEAFLRTLNKWKD